MGSWCNLSNEATGQRLHTRSGQTVCEGEQQPGIKSSCGDRVFRPLGILVTRSQFLPVANEFAGN